MTEEALDIGALEDFEPGRPQVVKFQNRELAVVRWGDEVFALRNVCPHQTETLAKGRAHITVECGEKFGTLRRVDDRPVIACPRHMWTFDLHDGQCTVDPALRVRTYDVRVDDGRVVIHDAPRPVEVPA